MCLLILKRWNHSVKYIFFWPFIINKLVCVLPVIKLCPTLRDPICTVACQASLSSTISWSLLKYMSIESMILSYHFIFHHAPPFAFNLSQHQGIFFPVNWLFASGGQSIAASASIFPVNIQGWFPLELPGLIYLELTGLISLQSKGLSRVSSSTAIQKHQFYSG